MSDVKPFASLSSGLLARKGAAKPAMRPQGFNQGVSLEDLGWNDMGHGPQAQAEILPIHREEQPEHVPSSIAALTPAPRAVSEAPADAAQAPVPAVVEQQRAIEESFAPKPVREPAAVVPLPPRALPAVAGKAKAAFTLRLDAERHLKLRLACAVSNRSAQRLVTEALDEFLASLPELDAMASRAPAKLGKGR